MADRIRRLIGNMLVLAAAGVIGLLAAEVAVRVAVPGETRYYIQRPGTQTIFRPDTTILPGLSPETRFTVNRDGLRGRPYDPEDGAYRILAIGGSTTESAYLDDGEVWTALLETQLGPPPDGRPLWVGNAGRSGLNTRDHVVEAARLLPQFAAVDAVLVLTGVNDLTVALAQGDAWVPAPPITADSARAEHERRAFVIVPGRLTDPGTEWLLAADAPWYKRMALWQLAKRFRLRLHDATRRAGLNQDQQGQHIAEWRTHRNGSTARLDGLPDLTGPLGEFRASLLALVEEVRAHGKRLVLVSQPALWRADLGPAEEARLWLGGTGDFMLEPGHGYYRPGPLAEAMAAYNRVLLAVCAERDVECVDLGGAMAADTTLFYDDVHFTVKGSRHVAQVLADSLRQRAPWSP